MQQQQLELPADVADKIVGMLKVKARLFAVLMVVTDCKSKIKRSCHSSSYNNECTFLCVGKSGNYYYYSIGNCI